MELYLMWRPAANFSVLLLSVLLGCIPIGKGAVTVWKARVVATYPHDPGAYTQGLVIDQGLLFEGTGRYGSSTLREVDLKTGAVLKSLSLDKQYFGEGITILNGKIYQLTWKNNYCLIYDMKSFQYEGFFRYPYEGWGLTDNGKELIVSDGSSDIRFVDPSDFHELRKISVKDEAVRIKNLNELEYIDDEIWANIWYEDRIARISPESGKLLGWIDLSSIYPASKRKDRDHVLNGIAQDPDSKKLYVTGKNWPDLFEIEIMK